MSDFRTNGPLVSYLGFEDQAKIRCPYSVLGIYDYIHTSSSGTMTCNGEDSLDMCADNKEMKFDYTTCPTIVAYSGKVAFFNAIIEPPRGKANNVVFEQVRHKPTCTVTEKS